MDMFDKDAKKAIKIMKVNYDVNAVYSERD